MAYQRARQLELARAQFAPLIAESPLNFGPINSKSYRESLLSSRSVLSLPKPLIQTHESRLQRVRNRIAQIRSSSTWLNPVCMRCGTKGHLAVDCRDPPICFICNKIGHKGIFCTSHKSPDFRDTPSPSQAAVVVQERHEASIPMGPPPNLRGFQCSRPYPLGRAAAAGDRATGSDQPATDGQRPPDRPFQGRSRPPIPGVFRPTQPTQVVPSRPTTGQMQQTSPDRPVQAREQRSMIPRPKAQATRSTSSDQIMPPILIFASTPESEAIDRELQLSFLLDDIAGWGLKKVERLL